MKMDSSSDSSDSNCDYSSEDFSDTDYNESDTNKNKSQIRHTTETADFANNTCWKSVTSVGQRSGQSWACWR